MTNLIALPLDVEVSADLKTIIKYHPTSAIYLTEQDTNEYRKTVNVKVLQDKDETDLNPIESYRYEDIAQRTLPDPSHSQTLLVLVQHLVEIDWESHAQSFITDDNGVLIRNEYDELRQVLSELKVLASIIDNEDINMVKTKVQLTEAKPFGDNPKTYNVKGMAVQTEHSNENKEIIQLLIKNRIARLRTFHIDLFFQENFDEIVWTIEKIDNAIKLMTKPMEDYRAKWLFCKLVSETVLKYLKGEMDWQQGDIEITEKQGVFIHTLLALFNFIDLEQEILNDSDMKKAKYIRTFFRKDVDGSFPELTLSEFT